MGETRFLIYHFLLSLTNFVGMRDRLRCPRCKAVGTYKPHGGLLLDFDRNYRVARIMCKWCGYYRDKNGVDQAYADKFLKHWTLRRFQKEPDWVLKWGTSYLTTPQEIIENSGHNINPWEG